MRTAEDISNYRKGYYLVHREERLNYQKGYNLVHREQYLNYQMIWRLANPDYQKIWRLAHSDYDSTRRMLKTNRLSGVILWDKGYRPNSWFMSYTN